MWGELGASSGGKNIGYRHDGLVLSITFNLTSTGSCCSVDFRVSPVWQNLGSWRGERDDRGTDIIIATKVIPFLERNKEVLF